MFKVSFVWCFINLATVYHLWLQMYTVRFWAICGAVAVLFCDDRGVQCDKYIAYRNTTYLLVGSKGPPVTMIGWEGTDVAGEIGVEDGYRVSA